MKLLNAILTKTFGTNSLLYKIKEKILSFISILLMGFASLFGMQSAANALDATNGATVTATDGNGDGISNDADGPTVDLTTAGGVIVNASDGTADVEFNDITTANNTVLTISGAGGTLVVDDLKAAAGESMAVTVGSGTGVTTLNITEDAEEADGTATMSQQQLVQ